MLQVIYIPLMHHSGFAVKLYTMASLKLKIWLRWFMAAAILWTQGIGLYAGESSLWDARRTNVRRLQSESAPSSTNSAKTLLAALPGPSPVAWDGAPPKRSLSTRDAVAALVAGHGWVREAHLAPRPGAPVIVHFQDAHGIEEAQRHLSVMVGRWAAANPSAPVALEGASGPIDVGGLRNFPNRSITGDIAEFLLRRGLIAGPEHAALTLEKTPDFLGAEDNALYRQNVDALRAARADNRATARWRLFQENLDRLENRLASPTLRAFDRRSRDYDAGRSSLGDFLLYLSDLKLPPGPSTPNMDALLQTLSLEKSLDFKAVEAQRRRLVETLVERLPRAALEDMVALGLDHRAGRLGPAAYHRALRSACRAHGIDLRRYGPLPAYIDYLEQADRIDRSALLAELETRRRFVQDALARTEAERVLVDLSRDLALLEKTFAQALAPADWRRYQSRRPALLTLAARTRALDPAADLTEFSPADLKPFEDFCALALRRNDALSQNLLAAISARNAHTGLLVAGGFHTDGLTDLWRKKGVSFVVVAPALREIPSENAYLDILARDPMPIEKMIAGERVYLSRPIALASSGIVRTFYFALQRLLQNGLPTVQEAGVRLSRTPLRGGIAFQIGGTALFARFGEASDRWAARARAWGRRWADNFSPAAADRGGMMFWLPRLWNAATPKAWHINARQYRFLSVPVEAGFAGAMAWATVAAFGMPLDFDIFVRLSLAHYAAFHLLDFLTRDRRRAPFNGLMAGLIATLPGLFYALPPSWTSQAGITPAHVVYGAFLILHAAANGLLIRGRRSFRPVSPESVTLVPAGRPTPPPTGSAARSRVAVLVLTHNDTADTVRLIERMAAWPRSDDLPWELIVVDNASSDAPPALLAEAVARVPGGRLIVNVENTGAAEGRNVGLRHLLDRPTGERPDYVFLLDSDVRPTASTLKDLVAVADASPAQRVVWAPPLHFESQPDRVWRNWYHNVWRWPGQWSVDRGDALPAGDRAAVDGVATAAALVRLDAFENYGLFTPGYFFGNEDRDWCARVRKAGGEIAMAPVKEKILHNVHQSLEGNLYGNFSPVRTYYILRSMMLIFTYRSPLAERAVLRLTETGLTLFRVLRTAWRTRNPRVIGAAWAGLVDGVLGRDGVGRGPDFRTPAPVATPPALDAAFPLTVMEPAPEGVFRDRRAPAAPSPVATIPNGRRTETTGPAVFDPTPVNRPTTPPANPAALPTKFRPAAETTPSPAPRRPAARPPTPKPATEDELKERLVTALFSLSGALPRKSLVDFRVRNLRQQVDAFPAAGSFYPRLAAAWESGVERTVLLSSWGPRRSLRVPLGDLPIPIVVQGIHFLLEMRDGQPALVFANGKYLAPLDDTDTQPVLFGRDVMAQVTGTPELELLDFSQKHFRFWRNEGDVVIEDLSTNGTVVPIRQTNGVPYDERTHFAGTVDGTRFHSTRRHYLGSFLLAGILLTALLLAPIDASAATLIPLDGGGLKALVESGDSLWRILTLAEGGTAQEIAARVTEIANLNQLANPHLIFPGQEILLREAGIASVSAGPNLLEAAAGAASPSLGAPAALPTMDVSPLSLIATPLLGALAGIAVVTAVVARVARHRTPVTLGDTTFLDSEVLWEDVVSFPQKADLAATPAPAPAPAQIHSLLPMALLGVATLKNLRRLTLEALNSLWRSPLRPVASVLRGVFSLAAFLAGAPGRVKTSLAKRHVNYQPPTTFLDSLGPRTNEPAATAREPLTALRHFTAVYYSLIGRRPLAHREAHRVARADLTDDYLPIAGAAQDSKVLAIGPDDADLGEYTIAVDPLIPGKGPAFDLDTLEGMPGAAEPAPATGPAPFDALARRIDGQDDLLLNRLTDDGLFTAPAGLQPSADGKSYLVSLPFPKKLASKIRRQIAWGRFLGTHAFWDPGDALTLLYEDGWLSPRDEPYGQRTPEKFRSQVKNLFSVGTAGRALYDTSKETLHVVLPAKAAWRYFFKMWWEGLERGYPKGTRPSVVQADAFYGGETLRFPSGEPLVNQLKILQRGDGAFVVRDGALDSIDGIADYTLLYFTANQIDQLRDAPETTRGNPDAAKAALAETLKDALREKGRMAAERINARLREMNAPPTARLQLSLAVSWKIVPTTTETTDGAALYRLVPILVSATPVIQESEFDTPRPAPAAPATAAPSEAAPTARPAADTAFRAAARTVHRWFSELPERIYALAVTRPWTRLAAPLVLAFALVALPVLALGQTAARATWTPSEAVMTDQIPANLLKELSKSLPPGTDMAALLRGTDPATSARLLSGAVDLLRKFEGGRFLAVLEKTRPHVVLAPRGPEAAAAVDIRNKRPILYIGGAEAQPAYLFVALVHELSHLGRSDQLRAKKISPPQDEGLALEDTARAMEFYAGLSVVRIAYDQRQINEQRWIAHRFLDGTIKAAPHVLSPREVQLLTAPLRAAVHLAERRRYPGVIYLSSKNLGGGRYEVRFRVPQSGAEIVVDVTPERVSAAPGGTAGTLAMLGGIVMVRRGPPPNEDEANTARAALLRSLLRGEAGPVRFQIPTPVFKNGDNYWGATGMDDLRRRVATATADRLRDGHAATVVLLAEDAASAAAVAEGRVTEAALEAAALREAGAAAARDARDRSETTVHLNLLGFDQWEEAERDRIRHYTAGLVTALTPGTALVVPVDRPGPLGDWLDAATRRGVRVRTVTPAEAPGLANDAGQLVLSSLVDWIERENAKSAPPLARGSRVIARNDDAVVPLSGFVIIAVERLSAAIAREIETLRVLLTQA